ncbi:MAG: hypothetical protein LBF40_08180, partial [Deltaproteobacteria bacterium]|nr:hypothetical protein [Deltaproteobacteria bacterium]
MIRETIPSEKELKRLKQVRLVILVVVTVAAFSAIALFSATTGPPPPGTPMAEDYDRRGDPGFTFEVGQA